MKENAKQPAFPSSIPCDGEYYGGLTKREYFVAQAMRVIKPPQVLVGDKETAESFRDWANKCVEMADKILMAL